MQEGFCLRIVMDNEWWHSSLKYFGFISLCAFLSTKQREKTQHKAVKMRRGSERVMLWGGGRVERQWKGKSQVRLHSFLMTIEAFSVCCDLILSALPLLWQQEPPADWGLPSFPPLSVGALCGADATCSAVFQGADFPVAASSSRAPTSLFLSRCV